MAMNEAPRIQRNICGPMKVVTQAPTAPARPWLTSVATKMPRTIGQGLRKRAANTNASSWVLSPISAKATMAVETKKASMVGFFNPAGLVETRIDCTPTPAIGSACSQWSRPAFKPHTP